MEIEVKSLKIDLDIFKVKISHFWKTNGSFFGVHKKNHTALIKKEIGQFL